MKKIQRFTDIRPEDVIQEELYLDRNIFEEDSPCHAKRTDHPALKSKARARKITDKSIRNIREDNSYEDGFV